MAMPVLKFNDDAMATHFRVRINCDEKMYAAQAAQAAFDLVASLEEEIRSLEVLTTHRVDHGLTDKLGIPQKSNALHVQVRSLREKVNKFLD